MIILLTERQEVYVMDNEVYLLKEEYISFEEFNSFIDSYTEEESLDDTFQDKW